MQSRQFLKRKPMLNYCVLWLVLSHTSVRQLLASNLCSFNFPYSRLFWQEITHFGMFVFKGTVTWVSHSVSGMLRRVDWYIFTELSKKDIASKWAVWACLGCLTLKKWALISKETSVTLYHSTWREISEDWMFRI